MANEATTRSLRYSVIYLLLLLRPAMSTATTESGLSLSTREPDLQDSANGVSTIAPRHPSSCDIPRPYCLPCNKLDSGSEYPTEYYNSCCMSCFLSGQWNETILFGRIPSITKSLLLRCTSEVPIDLGADSFNRFEADLQKLGLVRCKVGTFSAETFSGLTLLRELLLTRLDVGMQDNWLSVLGGIQTYASVKLSRCDIRILEAGTFGTRLSNISELDLSYNKVSRIGDLAFGTFPSLKKLFLGNNNISLVEDGAFRGLRQLSILDAKANPYLFPRDWCLLKNIPSLTELDLSFTNITNISQFNCAPLPRLNQLLVSGNRIQQLTSSAFGSMPNLNFIDISDNELENVPQDTFSGGLTSLKHLRISGNHLQYFPIFAFEPTPNIEIINISHNHLREVLGGTFSGLVSLRTIDLSYNQLVAIKEFAFVDLNNLSFVDLRHNSFVKFPEDLLWLFLIQPPHIKTRVLLEANQFHCGCTYMYSIRAGIFEDDFPSFLLPDNTTWTCQTPPPVKNKRIMSLPLDDFWCPYHMSEPCYNQTCKCYTHDLDKSYIFFCQNNTISSLSNIPNETAIFQCDECLVKIHLISGDLQASDVLKTLILRNIGLKKISLDALQNFPNLQKLDLSHNILEEFIVDILTNLTNLHTIDLSNNRITTLSSTLETNLNLMAMHIHSNSLETLADGFFNRTPLVDNVTLHDNPFICNCSLFWLKRWLQSNLEIIPDVYAVTCYVNSSDLETYPMIQVADKDFGCYSLDVSTLTVQEYTAVIITTTITVLFLIVIGILFRHRRAIRVILYTRYGFHVLHDDDDGDVKLDDIRWEYDAYVAYSDDDLEYVVQNIIPVLEEECIPRYKLCIRHRDFPPGSCIATTIVTSVETSRRNIILLSRSFLQDEWCLLEFKTAHQRVLQDKRNKNLILVFIDRDLAKDEMDEDMRYYVTANAYLVAGDRLFQENLVYEMPRNSLAEIHGEAEQER